MNSERDEMSFSQRIGKKPFVPPLQIDHISSELKNLLWNEFVRFYYTPVNDLQETFGSYNKKQALQVFFERIWIERFKQPIDEFPEKLHLNFSLRKLRVHYQYDLEWVEVYDFLEFVVGEYPSRETNKEFTQACNLVLSNEHAGYRFVGGKIVQIASDVEAKGIEDALEVTRSHAPLIGANLHLQNALEKMGEKPNPDYRNSIKESISAVEATCQKIASNDQATLNDALDAIERNKLIEIDSRLKKGFQEIYGYTNVSKNGIRHTIKRDMKRNEPTLDIEDAEFMLVACSAFVNYLVVKALKSGLLDSFIQE